MKKAETERKKEKYKEKEVNLYIFNEKCTFFRKKLSMTKKKKKEKKGRQNFFRELKGTFKDFFLKIYFPKIFAPPNICDPNFCPPPNIYDKSTPLMTSNVFPVFYIEPCFLLSSPRFVFPIGFSLYLTLFPQQLSQSRSLFI